MQRIILTLTNYVAKMFHPEYKFTRMYSLTGEYLDNLKLRNVKCEEFWECVSGNPNALPIIEKHMDNISWAGVSRNPNAIHILEQNLDRISWRDFSMNSHPRAIEILKKNLDKVHWDALHYNENAIDILSKNLNIVNWRALTIVNKNAHILFLKYPKMLATIYQCNWCSLARNPNAYVLFKKYPNYVKWDIQMLSGLQDIELIRKCFQVTKLNTHVTLCQQLYYLAYNQTPEAFAIFKENMHLVDFRDINFDGLNYNPNAIELLEKYPEKINNCEFLKNPNAIDLIEKKLDKFNTGELLQSQYVKMLHDLCSNKNATKLIIKNLEYVRLINISYREDIMEILCDKLDTNKMRQNCEPFAKELAEYVFHPARLQRICEKNDIELEDYLELIGD